MGMLLGLGLGLGLRSAYRMVGRPAEPWHGQTPAWLELMVGILFLFLPSYLALSTASAIYILDGREGDWPNNLDSRSHVH